MLTVTQLAKRCALSRTSVLYYERVGLLKPAYRSDNGYRWYGEKELKQLEAIVAYRAYGVPINHIAPLLDRDNDMVQEQILRAQFNALEKEVQKLRQQQKAIVLLLEQPLLLEQETMNKARWVEIMTAAGLNEHDMDSWHQQFERMEPEAHQAFLVSLGIEAAEVKQIRERSKS